MARIRRHGCSVAPGILRREGPMSASTFAARTELTAGVVTGLVDRLAGAGAGHADRERDPSDGRRLVIAASAPADPQLVVCLSELGNGCQRRRSPRTS